MEGGHLLLLLSWEPSRIFVREVKNGNLSGRPLKLILGDEASQDLAKFQRNVLSPEEEKEHSF